MPTKSLTNLLRASGIVTPANPQSLRNNAGSGTRVAGDSMRSFIVVSMDTTSINAPSDAAAVANFFEVAWVLTPNAAFGVNNLTLNLTPKSTQLTVTDVEDASSVPVEGGVSISPININYTATQIVISARITNNLSLAEYVGPGGEAYRSFRVNAVFKADGDRFNDDFTAFVAGLRIVPSLDGQGSPGVAPTAPGIQTTPNPVDSTSTSVVFTAVAAWFGLTGSTRVIEWSYTNDFAIIEATGTTLTYPLIAGEGTGLTIDVFMRARLTAPYTTPDSSTATTSWTDPRPQI